MSNWKNFERSVATYFGTTRRNRGNDFGQSDVEVKATLYDWLPKKVGQLADRGIVAECKYSKDHIILDICRKHDPQTAIFVGVIGSFIVMWLDDFEEFFLDFIHGTNIIKLDKHSDKLSTILKYNFIKFDKQEPGYLEKYRQQSKMYSDKEKDPYLPVVCMAKAKAKKQLISIHVDDISEYIKKTSH